MEEKSQKARETKTEKTGDEEMKRVSLLRAYLEIEKRNRKKKRRWWQRNEEKLQEETEE